MPITLNWHAIALRLLLAVIAGAAMGFDRGTTRLLTLELKLQWRAASRPTKIPDFIDQLSQDPRIATVRWEMG